MLVEVYVAAVSWMLAGVFAVACRHKFTAWTRFKASFLAYRIVPEPLVAPVAGLLAVAEAGASVALVGLFPPGLVLAAGMLVVYAVAVGVNVIRGRTQIDCGCGDEPTPVSLVLVVRNLFLAAAALGGFALAPAGGLELLTGLVGLAAAAVAYGLYIAVEQLIANRGRHQRLWLGVS